MDQILGQDRAVAQLDAALASGRIHHAYVFHGPVGVGKFTTAVAFARVMLCYEPQTKPNHRACGSCPSCRLFASAQGAQAKPTHPDLHIITKELARYSDDALIRQRKLLTIPVNVLRSALIDPVYRAAQLQHHKLFIVDEAELLDLRGQNILLKTLEEPPEQTTIILVTCTLHMLLPTIRSRGQGVGFLPLPYETVVGWLDDKDFSTTDHRQWVAEFAEGSLGRAQLAMDYDLYPWGRALDTALAQMAEKKFDVDTGKTMSGLIDAFAKQWGDRHEGASKEAANKQGAGLMWSVIGQIARRQLRVTAHAHGMNGDQQSGPWLSVIDALTQAEQELTANVNLTLVCDHLASLLHRALTTAQPARGG